MPISPKVPYKDRQKWEKTSHVNHSFQRKKKRFSKLLLLLLKIVNIEIAIWVAEKHDFIFSCQTLLRRLFIFNVYLHVCKKLDTIFHEPKPTHHSKGVL